MRADLGVRTNAKRRGRPPGRGGLPLSSRSVTPFALEGGHRLARLDHDCRWLTAATALSHDLRRKFLDRLAGCGYRLLCLGPEFGLAECRPSTSLIHRKEHRPGCDFGSLSTAIYILRLRGEAISQAVTTIFVST